jgi:hypothetical protein
LSGIAPIPGGERIQSPQIGGWGLVYAQTKMATAIILRIEAIKTTQYFSFLVILFERTFAIRQRFSTPVGYKKTRKINLI